MTETTCRVCGVRIVFDETRRGRRPVQCSKACTNQAYRDRRSADKQAARLAMAAPCETCGGPVDVPRIGPVPRWCGAHCREVAYGIRLAAPLAEVVCALPECDVAFVPNRRGVRCCSERHGQVLWNRESRADGRQSNPAWDDRRRENYQRRRALKSGADAERVVNRDVFERDGWRCGLCAEPVDAGVAWPDPLSPSLDHVLPLAAGGSHTMSNVQLAHLGCNVAKGARVGV